MKFKNKEITPILMTLLTYKEKEKDVLVENSGLLLEELRLASKRKLQKLRVTLLDKQKEFQADYTTVVKECDAKVLATMGTELTSDQYRSADAKSEEAKAWQKAYEPFLKDLEKELEILVDEEFEVAFEKVSAKEIESIKSSTNYDFEIIDKIAQ